jgi:hypothetical protein
MKKIYNFILISFCLIQLNGCVSHQNDENTNIYFNINQFLNQQIKALNTQKPSVQKTVISDTKTETNKLIIKDWQKELKMFAEADINKSIFKGSYTLDESQNGSNLQKTYKARKPSLKTKSISIWYSSTQKVQKIEIDYAESNFLFGSDKKLILECDPQSQTIQKYSIKGHQSNLFGSKSHYEVKGEIL